MSKSVSGESLLESLGYSKGETFEFMPVGRGGAFGEAGQVLWENSEIFYVVLIRPFVKFHHLTHIHVISVLSAVKYQEG